jgi:heterodisulfide reductase subunit B
MRFAIFWGCKIPFYLAQYALSSRSVLEALGVKLVDIEFGCCGYPVRNLNFDSFILSAARNLALAQQQAVNILTPCKCCFGTLKHADYWLRQSDSLRDNINALLEEEGLRWQKGIEIKHLLSALLQDVGVEAIKDQVKHPYEGLKVAAHYGCHALRPSKVTHFDNPTDPTLFERLIAVTGAKSVRWQRRLECCGNPLWGKNNQLSLDLMARKLADAKQAGADYLCSACTYCQIQFDTVQAQEFINDGGENGLPSILFPQLLGLSLGLSEGALGLNFNKIDISGVCKYLSRPNISEP